MALSYRKRIELAHELGAKYELGYWKFPTEDAKAEYRRRASGLEWTPEQLAKADAALVHYREILRNVPMEPEGGSAG